MQNLSFYILHLEHDLRLDMMRLYRLYTVLIAIFGVSNRFSGAFMQWLVCLWYYTLRFENLSAGAFVNMYLWGQYVSVRSLRTFGWLIYILYNETHW